MNAGGLWESQGKRPPREAVTGHLIRREGPYTPEIGNTLLRSSISLSGFSFSQPIYKGRSRSPVTHLGAACVNTEPTPATQTMCARAPTPGLRDPPSPGPGHGCHAGAVCGGLWLCPGPRTAGAVRCVCRPEGRGAPSGRRHPAGARGTAGPAEGNPWAQMPPEPCRGGCTRPSIPPRGQEVAQEPERAQPWVRARRSPRVRAFPVSTAPRQPAQPVPSSAPELSETCLAFSPLSCYTRTWTHTHRDTDVHTHGLTHGRMHTDAYGHGCTHMHTTHYQWPLHMVRNRLF